MNIIEGNKGAQVNILQVTQGTDAAYVETAPLKILEPLARIIFVHTHYGGTLHRLRSASTGGGSVATLLSATGCVLPTDPTRPATGLVPYAPNAPFWSDGAAKERYLGLPNGATISVTVDDDFELPNGTVLMKSFRLGGRLVETRLFMRHTDGEWAGYTYEWNGQGPDAARVIGGKTVSVGGQAWVFPSEAQCLACHTAAAGRSLGLEIAQLNGELLYPQTGRVANQVVTLNAVQMFSPPETRDPSAMPALADPAMESLSAELGKAMQDLEGQIHRAAGRAFNVASTRELSQVLFEEVGLPVQKRLKTGPSTDQDVLEKLAEMHPLPRLVLEHRSLAKLKGTYVDALPQLVDPQDGRIHTTYNQAGAATGRLSSQDPNLQNIPVRTEISRRIRAAFVAPPGMRLLSADYSQIELRILAHFSGDPALLAAFRAGEDVHTSTAAETFGVPREAILCGNSRKCIGYLPLSRTQGKNEFAKKKQDNPNRNPYARCRNCGAKAL